MNRYCYPLLSGGILAPLVSPTEAEKEEDSVEQNTWPHCRKCPDGQLLPLSDFGSQGAPIHYKAWVCSDPDCGFNIKIRNGDVYLNEPIASGAMHAPRIR